MRTWTTHRRSRRTCGRFQVEKSCFICGGKGDFARGPSSERKRKGRWSKEGLKVGKDQVGFTKGGQKGDKTSVTVRGQDQVSFLLNESSNPQGWKDSFERKSNIS